MDILCPFLLWVCVQPSFHVGMKGVAESDVAKLESLILEILGAVEKEGFSPGAVEAAINKRGVRGPREQHGVLPPGPLPHAALHGVVDL